MKNLLFTLVLLFTQQLIIAQNVGIGTNNPQAKLDVHGNARIDSIPQVSNMNYLVGVDQNGFLLKTPSNLNSSQQDQFPEIIGAGIGIMGSATRPASFYRSRFDKVLFSGSGLYFKGDSLFPQFRDLSNDWNINGQYIVITGGAVSLGNYLYIITENVLNGLRRVYRFNRLNIGAGGTLMSFSGLGLSGNNINSFRVVMACDGTYFYFNYQSGNSTNDNIISKYSLSGTVFQHVSNISLGSVGDCNQSLLVDSSGNYYTISSNTDRLFKKFSSSGTFIYSWKNSQSHFLNWRDHFYSAPGGGTRDIYERFEK